MIKHCRSASLAAVIGAVSLLTVGCAASGGSNMAMDEVRAMAEEALRTANSADYQAQQAKAMAQEASEHMHMMMKKKGMRSMMK